MAEMIVIASMVGKWKVGVSVRLRRGGFAVLMVDR
jgi:hypothetical protein